MIARTVEQVGSGPVFLSVDIDVLDPAFAPGTGTPEPGSMTSVELLQAVRLVAERLDLVGADVVEVIPAAVGSADVTALVATGSSRVLTGSRSPAAAPEGGTPTLTRQQVLNVPNEVAAELAGSERRPRGAPRPVRLRRHPGGNRRRSRGDAQVAEARAVVDELVDSSREVKRSPRAPSTRS